MFTVERNVVEIINCSRYCTFSSTQQYHASRKSAVLLLQ